MKKLTLIFFALLFASSLLSAGTIANVIAHKDLLLTIDRGTSDGVATGMKGIVKAVYKEPSGEYTINIGIFTVKKASSRTAEVLIEIGKGLNPEDARYVVFDQDLLAADVKTETKAETKTESIIPEKPAENADWYLEQGDREAEAGNFKIALQHYRKASALAPGNLVAKEKCSEMQMQIDLGERKEKFDDYLEKADANYEKNDVKFAFLYLVEGLRVYPEGSAEIQSRLTSMAEEYPQEIDALLVEKNKELKDVRKQLDAMLGRTETAKPAPAEIKPAEIKTSTPPAKYSEPFLQKIAGKANKVRQNDKGYWEAVFPRNLVMIYIPEGKFSIGSPDKDGDADEHPVHRVSVSGYWIGKTEVTFAQYDAFCQETGVAKPDDEGWGRGERPAIYVSWKEANDFCAWLKKKTGLTFRLPTEAEWEKAARDRFPWGSAQPTNELANFDKELMKTSSVGSYPLGASPYGVLDMAGNVWEWLADWYAADYYANSDDSNPQGPEEGTERVVRGGAWSNGADLIRSGNRSQENPESRLNIIGFRLALSDGTEPIEAKTEKTGTGKPAREMVKSAVTQANTIKEAKSSEPFLQKVKGKADKVRQNDKGYWEAVFPRNIVMIFIPEGEFSIGSPARDGDADEHPAHKVFVSGYWIGKTEVTFAQYDAFCQEMGLAKLDDEGWGRGERPAIYVSWKEANDFCAWLRKKTGFAFRLPTEAEWEKAARDRFPWGDAQPTNELANFDKELMKTSSVGSYPLGASPYGVLDMAGNVWEWLADWYAADYYANSADSDPQGPEEGTERVVRGGAWSNSAEQIRSGNRSQESPESRLNIIGFRLALSGK